MDTVVLGLCIKIFLCRIADVSLGTVRTVLTVKGKSVIAACFGFLEVLIWFLIVREALNDHTGGLITAAAYAGGFAAGTLVGGYAAKHLIRGKILIQLVTTDKDDDLVCDIRNAGFGVSVVDVKSSEYGKEKYMLFIEIENNQLKELKALVKSHPKRIFMIVQETNYVANGFFKSK